MKKISFETNNKSIAELLEIVKNDSVILHFVGILSKQKKYQSKVTISIEGSFECKTKTGTINLIGNSLNISTISHLPNWEEQTTNNMPNILDVDFYAEIINVNNDTITVKLPEKYNSYSEPSKEFIYSTLTEKISMEDGLKAAQIRGLELSFIGIPFDNWFFYPNLFDFDNNQYNLDALSECDNVDIKDCTLRINDAFYNSIASYTTKFGKQSYSEIWADWWAYGYENIIDIPINDRDFMLRHFEDSAIVICFLLLILQQMIF